MEGGPAYRPLRVRNAATGPELVFEAAGLERQPALVAAFPYRNMNTAIRYLHWCEASKLERFFCRVVKREGHGWVMVSQGPRAIQRLLEEPGLLRRLQGLRLEGAEEGECPGELIAPGELEPDGRLAEGSGAVGPGPSLDEPTRAAIRVALERCPCLRPIWLPVITSLTRRQADQVRQACPWVMSSIVPLYDVGRLLASLEEGYLGHFMAMAVGLAREGVRRGYEFNAAVVVAAERRQAVGGAYSLQRPQEGRAAWEARRRRLEALDLGAFGAGAGWGPERPVPSASLAPSASSASSASPASPACSTPSAPPVTIAPAPPEYPYAGDAEKDISNFAAASETRFSPLLHAARNAIRVKATMPIDDYLLTGYDVFCVREPCIMCAMSLIHSRIRTLFYCVPREANGGANAGLSVPQLKNVNHRYTVVHLRALGEFLR